MLEVLELHLGSAPRRDLRFKPQVGVELTELEQFCQLPMGDPWEDADMLPVLDYLMRSKNIRTVVVNCHRS